MSTRRFAIRALCAAILLLAVARPASAQWPTVMMFYGDTLTQPVFAAGADTPAFTKFIGSPAPGQTITAKDMGDRPYVKVACFWGPRDNPASNGVRNLTDLKPEMTWQHGRFYPALPGKPAMLFMMSMTIAKQHTAVPTLTKVTPGRGGPVPADAVVFNVGGEVPEQTLAVLKRLGVATELR
jgi:hypothetical protein